MIILHQERLLLMMMKSITEYSFNEELSIMICNITKFISYIDSAYNKYLRILIHK